MINLLQAHRSVRNYTDEPISEDTLHTIIRSGQHASSSNFVQAYSAIHVTDQEKKEELARLSQNPAQILSAGAVLVLCMDFYRIQEASKQVGTEITHDIAENLLVGTTDVALFAQNIAIAAESSGYGICFIGGVRNAPEEISELLGLPKGVAPMYGLTIGVPAEDHEVKPRLPIEAIVHENAYDTEKYDTLLPAYDQTIQEYYVNRSSNAKESTWSESMAAFFSTPRRMHMREFLQKRGFDLK